MTRHFASTLFLLGVSAPLLASAAPAAPAATPHARVTELMTRALPDIPGREATMITVEYPPGARDAGHRHDADVFVYVLEGSIVMGVKGQPEVTLHAGDTWYEGPNDLHTVGRNASTSEPARFVVLLLKKPGAPILVPLD
ncbi:cupin domain-containing protein [Stenotrophomonas sp. 24(2023)]|uniref:cupin domain-containing protein n=1 Tax=Stenotrophomonas sp. 24(2023) TaxID=3068324 RepID=UPI0027E03299|nr:cupin domain-containing protein [Stenotrophomonas sp. 24(2023)]WMJ68243.1 cupin domain-containing protein [Stenotrophomonas sp. 24(2023)]